MRVARLAHQNAQLQRAINELREQITELARRPAVPPGAEAPAARPEPAVAKPSYAPSAAASAAAVPTAAASPVITPTAPVEPLRERLAAAAKPAVTAAVKVEPPPAPPQVTPPASAEGSEGAAAPAKPVGADKVVPPEPWELAAARTPSAPYPPRKPIAAPAWVDAARRWLFTGNLVAKLGLVILLIGVSFLLKYVATRIVVPIELRIAAVALADVFLLRWGWRIRTTRRSIGLPVQGAAIGILELLTFGSFHLYDLIPGGAAFAILFALTVFTCLLAVMQNAVWLALFGILTGFAAPIATSTGGGSHIGLFSYYALLNAGIFAIAMKRTWRSLNLAGFVLTFGIGFLWAVRSYTPADYLSVQLFLLLFVLFYTGISLAFASQAGKQPYVDATLVLGTPVVGAGLQFALVRDIPFGIAFAALGAGLYYTALAVYLWRRRGEHFRQLVTSFLTMGVLFGTIAIPMALDGRATSAAWAAEGAAIVWAGLQMKRRSTWMFGLALQAGAWLAFLVSTLRLTPEQAVGAWVWLGFLILAASAGAMAWQFQRHHDNPTAQASQQIGAGLWWLTAATLLVGAWSEIGLRSDGTLRCALLAFSALLVCAAVVRVGPRLRLAGTRGVGVLIQLLAAFAVLAQLLEIWRLQPDIGGWADQPIVAILLIAFSALFSSWRLRGDDVAGRRWSTLMLGWGAVWWFGGVLTIAAAALADISGVGAYAWLPWRWPAYACCVAGSSLLAHWAAQRLAWPQLRWLSAACWLWLGMTMADALVVLYGGGTLGPVAWGVLAILLAVGEFLLSGWRRNGWKLHGAALQGVHLLRTAGPWLAIWPAGYGLVVRWLAGPEQYRDLLAAAGWEAAGLWGLCLPLWLQMGAIAWLLRAVGTGRWPVAPLGAWYGRVVLPVGTAWCLLNVFLWNLTQDGTMAPLPYVPVLNPVDLSTAFVAALVAAQVRAAGLAGQWQVRMRWIGGAAAFGWLNLMLLRTASHVLALPYEAQALFASRIVEAMLSLVWATSALILMRFAVRRVHRPSWLAGAAILALVVAKLFLVDLDGSGSMERIVSFLGVGLLMLAIGYLAPFPTEKPAPDTTQDGEAA
ncbi:DUF2339 domain-containing protein [Pseudoduganella plicata]|nr:DUF2339 domain-containing protein [Pseudoduganella plicata]